ncbi:MAG: NYN domain-containing protein [Phycisphaerales bacterium]|nr:NYN domain-containing protein [Phycisphaerales bacterium]|tara:strand:- start:27637 stop:28302 length:666 start_codon:yes stop_codon:yes gene_type:complete
MKVILDTYNALHTTGILPPELAGMDAAGLVEALSGGRWARNQVLLVCDGSPPPGQRAIHSGGIRTIYAGSGCEADDLIEQLIERSDAPGQLLVVSSDRRIVKAARRRRCHTMDSPAFLRTIANDHERSSVRRRNRSDQGPRTDNLSSKAAMKWRNEFGIDEKDIAEFTELASNPLPKPPPPAPAPPPTKSVDATTRRTESAGELPEDVIAEAMRMLEEDAD